jgi:tetratricopeptide (TPR) repeat protein
LILALFAFFTWQRAMLWSDEEKLQLYWAYTNPDSPRAHNYISGYLVRTGRFEEADRHSREAIAHLPNSPLLNLGWLLQRIYVHQASDADFELTAKRLRTQPVDPQAVKAMRAIVDKIVLPGFPEAYRDASLRLLDAARQDSKLGDFSEFRRLTPYLKGRIYLAKWDGEKACSEFESAMPLYNDTDAGLAMVAEVASYRFYACAYRLLGQTEKVMEKQEGRRLKRSRAEYGMEIAGLRKTLQDDEAEWVARQKKAAQQVRSERR